MQKPIIAVRLDAAMHETSRREMSLETAVEAIRRQHKGATREALRRIVDSSVMHPITFNRGDGYLNLWLLED